MADECCVATVAVLLSESLQMCSSPNKVMEPFFSEPFETDATDWFGMTKNSLSVHFHSLSPIQAHNAPLMKPFRKMILFCSTTGRPGKFLLVKQTGLYTDLIAAAMVSLRRHLPPSAW